MQSNCVWQSIKFFVNKSLFKVSGLLRILVSSGFAGFSSNIPYIYGCDELKTSFKIKKIKILN